MSQGIFSSINPNTTSGTQLATILDDFKDAVVTGFSGTSRPANLQAYGYWVDTTDALSGILVYRMYDGTNDIEIFTVDTNNQSIVLPGVSDEFEILRISDDSLGAKLIMQKRRATGGGQTLTNDILGDVDFEGNDSSAISYVQARIRVVSTDDVSVSEQGCYMALSVTPTNGSALTEVLRLTGDKRVGVGVASPTKTIEVTSSDDSAGIRTEITEDSTSAPEIIIQKKRLATNGQVLLGDDIGSHIFKSVDQNGAEIEVARIDVAATQNHTDLAQGMSLVISTKNTDTNSFVEAIRLEDGEMTVYGEKLTQSIGSGQNLAAGTNNLFTVDGAIYGAFEASVFMHGENGVDYLQQKIKIEGVYDFDNDTWAVSDDSNSLGNPSKVATLSITDATILDVDYVNQIGSFNSGKYYLKITRFLR